MLRRVQPIRHLVRPLFVVAGLLLLLGLAPARNVQAGTLTVTTTVDELTSPGAGCSLREAIAEANAAAPPGAYTECAGATSGADTINLPAGTYTLTHANGQLIVLDNLTIIGAGAGSTTISGNNSVRVLLVSGGVSLTLQNLTVRYGRVNDHGAGIGLAGSALTVLNSIIADNLAENTTGRAVDRYGGGIYGPDSTVVIRDSSFSSNRVNANGGDGFGGGIAVVSIGGQGSLTVERSTFSGNQASSNSGFGGAIYVKLNGSATVTNSTFTGNMTRVASGSLGTPLFNPGGAINLFAGTLTITHSTIANNSGQDTTGGIVQTSGTLHVRNTIVANNTGGNCLFPYPPGTNTNNLRWPQADMTCTGMPPGDPLLGALANNGGPTQTMALQAGSAAIDKIASAGGCGVGVTTDQRGIARPQPAGGLCDIGAYEYQAPPAPPPTAAAAPKEVPEAGTLLLLGGGLGGLATWLGWQRRKIR